MEHMKWPLVIGSLKRHGHYYPLVFPQWNSLYFFLGLWLFLACYCDLLFQWHRARQAIHDDCHGEGRPDTCFLPTFSCLLYFFFHSIPVFHCPGWGGGESSKGIQTYAFLSMWNICTLFHMNCVCNCHNVSYTIRSLVMKA